MIVGRYAASSWSYPTVGTKTGTTPQVTGVTGFGDFQIGERGATLSGNVFEDVNYGGGAGRDRTAASGVGREGARVELYGNSGSSGVFVSSTPTQAGGTYAFTNLAAGSYTVRVVNDSVSSSRAGHLSSLKAVQTFRTDASSGTAVAVTDHVGRGLPDV